MNRHINRLPSVAEYRQVERYALNLEMFLEGREAEFFVTDKQTINASHRVSYYLDSARLVRLQHEIFVCKRWLMRYDVNRLKKKYTNK